MAKVSTASALGPLEQFAEGFLVELAALGYSQRGSEGQWRLMMHLSGWLVVQGADSERSD